MTKADLHRPSTGLSRLDRAALPNLAVFDQGGAATRRRWPGVSAALCLGRPARRTPGHAARHTDQDSSYGMLESWGAAAA